MNDYFLNSSTTQYIASAMSADIVYGVVIGIIIAFVMIILKGRNK